jgi:nucleoside triphosphate pyrophosphatase
MEPQNFSTRLLLASRSPRRAELLRAAGFDFDVCAADVDESVHPDESPAEYVRRLASAKSAEAAAHRSAPRGCGSPASEIAILAADTSVIVDDAILGKPVDDDDASTMLRRLSGRSHQVMTGLSIRRGERELQHVEMTAVYFAALSEEEIAWYVRSGEGRDKAGAYAIQGLASRFIPRIEGSYSNVVGLPIAAVCALIRRIENKRSR